MQMATLFRFAQDSHQKFGLNGYLNIRHYPQSFQKFVLPLYV
jgi:hypothetical protein